MVPRAEVVLKGWNQMADKPVKVKFTEQKEIPGAIEGDLVIRVGNRLALRQLDENGKAQFFDIGTDFPDIDFEVVEQESA